MAQYAQPVFFPNQPNMQGLPPPPPIPSPPSRASSQVSNNPRFSYTAMLKTPGEELYGRHLKTFQTNDTPKKPMGAVYDELKEHWIVADNGNDCVRFYSENSITGDAAFGSLNGPSAVAIMTPGQTFAVLDTMGIRIYDYRTNSFINTAANPTGRAFNCRGLGCTSQGDLVTIQKTFNGSKLVVYSSREPNKRLREFPYFAPPNPSVNNPQNRPNPSFLDVANNSIIVTDLGVNAFTIFDLDPHQINLRCRVQKSVYGRGPGYFQFISAAKFDANGHVLLADAGSDRLYHFDEMGNFISPVHFSDTFAYAAGIAVNSHNEMLVCDRRRNLCKLYQMSSKVPDNAGNLAPAGVFNYNRNGGVGGSGEWRNDLRGQLVSSRGNTRGGRQYYQ